MFTVFFLSTSILVTLFGSCNGMVSVSSGHATELFLQSGSFYRTTLHFNLACLKFDHTNRSMIAWNERWVQHLQQLHEPKYSNMNQEARLHEPNSTANMVFNWLGRTCIPLYGFLLIPNLKTMNDIMTLNVRVHSVRFLASPSVLNLTYTKIVFGINCSISYAFINVRIT